jgi:hypothetical protein
MATAIARRYQRSLGPARLGTFQVRRMGGVRPGLAAIASQPSPNFPVPPLRLRPFEPAAISSEMNQIEVALGEGKEMGSGGKVANFRVFSWVNISLSAQILESKQNRRHPMLGGSFTFTS